MVIGRAALARRRGNASPRRDSAPRPAAECCRLLRSGHGVAAPGTLRLEQPPTPQAKLREMKIPDYWEQAKLELAERDAVMRSLVARFQGLSMGSRGDAFSTLARSIVGQQISVKAAQSVWDRVH